ncbi:glycosyltransferase family 4 protein, partial [Dehalococcoidia bacterium]|nr:glycosyltransferase family 4 protein [Dehalococcoidia bacterium]
MDKLNILDISPMGIYPPIGGGHKRIHALNLELSKYHSIFLFSQGIRQFEVKYPIKSWTTRINNNYMEYRYITYTYLIASYFFSRLNSPTLIHDMLLKIHKPKVLLNKITECDVIQVEHPWQFKYIYENNLENKPIILNGQNIEYDFIKQTAKGALSLKLQNIVWEKERFAVNNADIVFMVSNSDKNRIHELYGIPKSKIHVIPNGANIPNRIPTINKKEHLKEKYGFKGKRIVIFIGSRFPPNVEAVNNILTMANISKHLENTLFLIVGRVGEEFEYANRDTIVVTGLVDEIKDYIEMADIAINPMMSGSGTNVKMLEYMAYGLPIITTSVGARGLEI